jgi:hypothetical protein
VASDGTIASRIEKSVGAVLEKECGCLSTRYFGFVSGLDWSCFLGFVSGFSRRINIIIYNIAASVFGYPPHQPFGLR